MEVQVYISNNYFEKSKLDRLNRLLLKNTNEITARERRFIDYTRQMLNDFVFEETGLYVVNINIGEFEGKMFAEPQLVMNDPLEPTGLRVISSLCYDVEVKTKYEFVLEQDNVLHTFIWELNT